MDFARKYKNQLLDTGLEAIKTASKKIVHEVAEAKNEFLGNQIADRVVKQKMCLMRILQILKK